MVFQGVEKAGAPRVRLVLGCGEELRGEGVQMLAGVIKAERSHGAELEAVLEDVP